MSKKKKAAPKATAKAKPAGVKAAIKPRRLNPAQRTAIDETVARQLSLVKTSLDDDKAEGVTVIEVHGRSSIADYIVIASGRSQRQVGAIADHLVKRLQKEGPIRSLRVEGMPQNDWVLIDTGDIIVHVFRPEVREFYRLERMWSPELDPKSTDDMDD